MTRVLLSVSLALARTEHHDANGPLLADVPLAAAPSAAVPEGDPFVVCALAPLA